MCARFKYIVHWNINAFTYNQFGSIGDINSSKWIEISMIISVNYVYSLMFNCVKIYSLLFTCEENYIISFLFKVK